MRMRQIEAFHAVILSGTVSGAARSLKVSQPTVSRLLSDLEGELGFSLFERRKGRVVPTANAMLFHGGVQEVTDAFGRLKATAGRINHDRNRALRIISMPALSMSVVPEIIDLFRKVEPQARIELITADSLSYFKMIRDTATDMALGNRMGSQPGIEQVTLAHVDFVCALPPGHRLAARDAVQVQDLHGERMILLSEQVENAFYKHDLLFADGVVRPDAVFRTQNSATAYSMVSRGMGVSLVEPFTAPFWRANGVQVRPFRPRLTYPFSASFNANVTRITAVKRLLAISKTVFQRYASEPDG